MCRIFDGAIASLHASANLAAIKHQACTRMDKPFSRVRLALHLDPQTLFSTFDYIKLCTPEEAPSLGGSSLLIVEEAKDNDSSYTDSIIDTG